MQLKHEHVQLLVLQHLELLQLHEQQLQQHKLTLRRTNQTRHPWKGGE